MTLYQRWKNRDPAIATPLQNDSVLERWENTYGNPKLDDKEEEEEGEKD